jgi:hypothetical protein
MFNYFIKIPQTRTKSHEPSNHLRTYRTKNFKTFTNSCIGYIVHDVVPQVFQILTGFSLEEQNSPDKISTAALAVLSR